VFRCISYWWPRAWCWYQIISPGVRPKTLSVPTAAQTKTQFSVLPQKSRTQLHIATYWIFTVQKLVPKQMFICYDLTTVSWLYVLTFYALFRVLFVYFILLYCLLFICVRLTRDSINATYFLHNGVFGSGYRMMPSKFFTTNSRCRGNKFMIKSAITRIVYEISRISLRPTRGILGGTIESCHTNSTTTDPGCYGNEIWNKMGYNSACVGNITEMFAPSRGFSRSFCWMMSEKFYRCCYGNKIPDKR